MKYVLYILATSFIVKIHIFFIILRDVYKMYTFGCYLGNDEFLKTVWII